MWTHHAVLTGYDHVKCTFYPFLSSFHSGIITDLEGDGILDYVSADVAFAQLRIHDEDEYPQTMLKFTIRKFTLQNVYQKLPSVCIRLSHLHKYPFRPKQRKNPRQTTLPPGWTCAIKQQKINIKLFLLLIQKAFGLGLESVKTVQSEHTFYIHVTCMSSKCRQRHCNGVS